MSISPENIIGTYKFCYNFGYFSYSELLSYIKIINNILFCRTSKHFVFFFMNAVMQISKHYICIVAIMNQMNQTRMARMSRLVFGNLVCLTIVIIKNILQPHRKPT